MGNIKAEKRADAAEDAVFPCILKILPQFVFMKKDPIILGCDVVAGIAKVSDNRQCALLLSPLIPLKVWTRLSGLLSLCSTALFLMLFFPERAPRCCSQQSRSNGSHGDRNQTFSQFQHVFGQRSAFMMRVSGLLSKYFRSRRSVRPFASPQRATSTSARSRPLK